MAEKETSGLSPWDPFRELELFRGFAPFRDRLRNSELARWAPAVDVAENDNGYTVTVELAGAKKDDVTVEVHDNVLTIRGEKRNEREEKDEQRRYVERSYGSFSRAFTLPANAAGDKVVAAFKDGVLTVEIPKQEESKPKVISVK